MIPSRYIAIALVCTLALTSVLFYLFYTGQLGWIDPDVSISIIGVLALASVGMSIFLAARYWRKPKKDVSHLA